MLLRLTFHSGPWSTDPSGWAEGSKGSFARRVGGRFWTIRETVCWSPWDRKCTWEGDARIWSEWVMGGWESCFLVHKWGIVLDWVSQSPAEFHRHALKLSFHHIGLQASSCSLLLFGGKGKSLSYLKKVGAWGKTLGQSQMRYILQNTWPALPKLFKVWETITVGRTLRRQDD